MTSRLNEDLDDKDEFRPKGSIDCEGRRAADENNHLCTPPPYGPVPVKIAKQYPHVIPNTLRHWQSPGFFKAQVKIKCIIPDCNREDWVFVSDLFHIKKCCEHRNERRLQQHAERAEELRQELMGQQDEIDESVRKQLMEDLDDKDEFTSSEFNMEAILARLLPKDRAAVERQIARMNARQRCQYCGDMMEPEEMDVHGPNQCDRRECPRCGSTHQCIKLECFVSDVPVTEELGGIRPAHLLIKAKHDSSWVEYTDAEGNTKFMQVHDVRSARDSYGRWAVIGIDNNGDPVHELYDLRQGFEHSGTFSGIRELEFKEVVRLAQQGVIRGKDGKEINTLSGLISIADEPLRKLIIKKHREAKAGGPSLAQIEKAMFAEPAPSSSQKRNKQKVNINNL